jgi:hypothetical protein
MVDRTDVATAHINTWTKNMDIDQSRHETCKKWKCHERENKYVLINKNYNKFKDKNAGR